jgi:hypothetical protein
LREWGLDTSALRERRTAELLDEHSRWEYDDSPYWSGEVDCCINAWTLANGVWLGANVSGIADWFLEHQMPDGGWNCEWVDGSRRSSFHSTLNSLKGLLAFEAATGSTADTRAARHRGEEYLLERRLIHRLTTNQPVAQWVNDFIYPIRWSYSAPQRLRILPPGRAARWCRPGSSDEPGNRHHSYCKAVRRQLAADRSPTRPSVV